MDYTAYINIIRDTLKKKIQLLDRLLEETIAQEAIFSDEEVEIEAFEERLGKKETLIEQLNRLDDGFELVYERFGMGIKENKLLYQEEISELQNYIRQIIDKDVLLQAKEKIIKGKLEQYLSQKKLEVKNHKVSNQVLGNYYKNMLDGYQGESIFLDKKK